MLRVLDPEVSLRLRSPHFPESFLCGREGQMRRDWGITFTLNYCIPTSKEQVKNLEWPLDLWNCFLLCLHIFPGLSHLDNFPFFELSFSLPKIHLMTLTLSPSLCLHTPLHTERYMRTFVHQWTHTLVSWTTQVLLSWHFPRLAFLSKTLPSSNAVFFGSAPPYTKFTFPVVLAIVCLLLVLCFVLYQLNKS